MWHGNWSGQWEGVLDRDRRTSPQSWRFLGQTTLDCVTYARSADPSPPCWLKLQRLDTAEAVIVRGDDPRVIPYHDDPILGTRFMGIDHRWGLTRRQDRQVHVWDGELIPAVQFDWYQAAELRDSDRRLVV